MYKLNNADTQYVPSCNCYIVPDSNRGQSEGGGVVHNCTYLNNGRFAGRLIDHSLVAYNAPTSTIYCEAFKSPWIRQQWAPNHPEPLLHNGIL